MSAPGRDLLDFIVANIEDDAPRLVYADWLEENGHAARAEFVRVQLQRARLPAGASRPCSASARRTRP